MFKTSKRKIVGLWMGLLILTLLGTIAVIYGVSYTQMNRENREMLTLYAEEYLKNDGLPETDEPAELPEGAEMPAELSEGAEMPAELPNMSLTTQHKFDLSTFYSVAFYTDGAVLAVNNDDPSQLSDTELILLAQEFLDSGKTYGIRQNMIFLITGEEYLLVSMMDNTVLGESIVTLLRYTLIFGATALVLAFILAVFFANWIIRPLEQNDERQRQFISDAGHELKTPVSVMNANAELLMREIGENRWLSNICHENDRMTEIVRSLLELACAESGRLPLEKVDFGRIVTATVLPFEGRAFEEGVSLQCESPEGLFLMGVPSQLKELVSILVDNAFSHVRESGEIRVILQKNRTGISLCVSNEGEAIPKEEQEKLFDRFYRGDSARTSDREGERHYGLGLSIAKAVANAHQGKITVDCDRGVTTFSVNFRTVTKKMLPQQ